MQAELNAIKSRLEDFKDHLRENLLEYTRKAFYILAVIQSPEILDIGCGSGIPTLELAKLSNGHITAIDIDQKKLNILANKADKAGLANRLTIINCSLLKLDFPAQSFDIIWAEGSISVIGFEQGIKQWHTLIKNGGFLVVHDEKGPFKNKIKVIPELGYKLIDYFFLDQKIWWDIYFSPLDKYIKEIQKTYPESTRVNMILQNDRREIDEFYIYPERNQSVFFIMKKI
jgi:ubiquinone/menaquinone biosynthesis C-methylase UbiE